MANKDIYMVIYTDLLVTDKIRRGVRVHTNQSHLSTEQIDTTINSPSTAFNSKIYKCLFYLLFFSMEFHLYNDIFFLCILEVTIF